MPRLLYTLGLIALLPWALLHLLWRARRQPRYLRHWSERFGYYSGTNGATKTRQTIWLHAVSVGETRAAEPLVALLRQHYPEYSILFTHMTPTGRQTSISIFGADVRHVYLPYDYPWSVERFLRHFHPVLGIIMETEIWPNLVAASRRHKTPLLLVNARLSERSARRYRWFPRLTRDTLRALAGVTAQSEADAARLAELGARDVSVTGNLKFDISPPQAQLMLGMQLRALWGPRPVLLAASTRAGEEALILAALHEQPIDGLLLVIVPRHPQRFDEVAALAQAYGWDVQRRTEQAAIRPGTSVVLGDSMGEMFAYYSACDVAFIGGSLLDYGSQNPIEACVVGAPLMIGPSTFNFAEVARQALACGAAQRVGDARELLTRTRALLTDHTARRAMSQAGRMFAERHRGASRRTLALLEPYLHRNKRPSH